MNAPHSQLTPPQPVAISPVEGRQASVFAVNIIPHTLAMTNLGDHRAGSRVNLEVDLLARYVQRLMATAPA